MKIQIILVFIICLMGTQAHAQNDNKKRTFRVLFINRSADALTKLHLFTGRSSIEIETPNLNFSQLYELPAGNVKVMLTSSPVSDPKLLPTGSPTADIPEAISHFYLILFNNPSNKVVPVHPLVVDAGDAALKKGQTLWFNLTEHTIAGKLGSQKLLIKPRSKALMDAPISGDGSYPVSFVYQKIDENRINPICDSVWTHYQEDRSVGFVFQEPGRIAPRVCMYADAPEPIEHGDIPAGEGE